MYIYMYVRMYTYVYIYPFITTLNPHDTAQATVEDWLKTNRK